MEFIDRRGLVELPAKGEKKFSILPKKMFHVEPVSYKDSQKIADNTFAVKITF